MFLLFSTGNIVCLLAFVDYFADHKYDFPDSSDYKGVQSIIAGDPLYSSEFIYVYEV